MKNLKRIGLLMTMALLGVVLLTGEVMAYSDAYFTISGDMFGLQFTSSGSGVQSSTFTFSNDDQMKVAAAYIPQLGGLTPKDPLRGAYVSIFNAGGLTGKFTIGAQNTTAGSDTWDIVDSAATIKVSSGTGGTGVNYFTATVKPLTIDLASGYINWGLGDTVATFNNTISSEILGILSNSDNDPHYPIMGALSYYNYPTVANTLKSSGGSTFQGFAANVTVVPEPGEWALMLAGLGLIGFSIYRKNPQFELAKVFGFRLSS